MKWLSYRDHSIIARPLSVEEVGHVQQGSQTDRGGAAARPRAGCQLPGLRAGARLTGFIVHGWCHRDLDSQSPVTGQQSSQPSYLGSYENKGEGLAILSNNAPCYPALCRLSKREVVHFRHLGVTCSASVTWAA